MQNARVKSFTLSEMLVVLIITAIVVGMAFSVLSLVQKQIQAIKKNFSTTTQLSLLEQRLWQDFNQHSTIECFENKIILKSDRDTVTYSINATYSLRNTDTIHSKLTIEKLFDQGREVKSGFIDAISISAATELPDYSIFVYSTPDATHFMNQDGF